jgi:hypothetical protein
MEFLTDDRDERQDSEFPGPPKLMPRGPGSILGLRKSQSHGPVTGTYRLRKP